MAPTTPTSFSLPSDQAPQQIGLKPIGTSLFVGTELFAMEPRRGNVLELTLGAPAKVAVYGEYIGGLISANTKRVAFSKAIAVSTGPSSWAFEYPNVLVYDRTTGALRTLPNPAGDYVNASDIAMTNNGDVYWISRLSRRWDRRGSYGGTEPRTTRRS
jgi:hypothetical protein